MYFINKLLWKVYVQQQYFLHKEMCQYSYTGVHVKNFPELCFASAPVKKSNGATEGRTGIGILYGKEPNRLRDGKDIMGI
jgi:hypothetical protein